MSAVHSPVRVSLLGAESTGKTTLAAQLARTLGALWVPEALRDFCIVHGRVPQPGEQQALMREQARREAVALQAAARCGAPLVLCDTAPLMTALYSELLFGDASLLPEALAHQRRYAFTLFLQPDIGWQADGLFRDGAQVQQPVTQRLQTLVAQSGVAHARIEGQGELRLQHALQALRRVGIAAAR